MAMRTPASARFAASVERLLRRGQPGGHESASSRTSTDAVSEQGPPASQGDLEGRFKDALIRAALSGTFNPNTVVDAAVSDTERTAILSRLAPLCEVRKEGSDTRWLLRATHRTSLLNDLTAQGALPTLLAGSLPETDAFGDILRKSLGGVVDFDFDTLPAASLLTIAAVREAVANLNLPTFDDRRLKQRISHARFLSDYDGLLEHGFLGRREQLASLHAFVAAAAPAVRNFESAVLTGLGGAGKSTLLAKFAQETVERETSTLAVLDFDRPGVDPRDTYWLEMEITRQVAFQLPERDDELRALRESARRAKNAIDRVTQPSSSEYAQFERMFRSVIEGTRNVLLKTPAGSRPLVLLLDTFEEVSQRGLTGKVVNWLRELADTLQPLQLKVVFSGRLFDKTVTELQAFGAATQIRLGELTAEEAHQLLVSQGLSDDWASKLASSDVLPRRPLELKLLSRLVASGSFASIEELEQTLRRGGAATSELFAGLVYRRVLQRVSEDIRPLASPGLVLRYLDTDIVQNVLLPVFRPSAVSRVEAQTALDALERYEWLTYRQGDEVWHRKDLRRSMLKVMIGSATPHAGEGLEHPVTMDWKGDAEELDQVRAIHMGAIRYFGARQDPRSQAEATYHRMMLAESAEELVELSRRDLQKANEYIGGDIVDLPAVSQALLRFSAGTDLSIDDVSLLPAHVRTTAYEDLGQRYVSDREFGLAAKLFDVPGIAHPTLRSWEAEALFETACWVKLGSALQDTDQQARLGARERLNLTDSTYFTAVLAPRTLPKLSPEELWRRWPKAESSNPGAQHTALDRIAVALILAQGGSPLDAVTRQMLEQSLPPFNGPASDGAALLQRRLFLLDQISGHPSRRRVALTPLTIKFDMQWLRLMRSYAAMVVGDPNAPPRLENFLNVAMHTLEQSSGKNARAILGEMARLPAEGTWFSPSDFELEALLNLFDGPRPELRNPTRFALLDGFGTAADQEELRQLLAASIHLNVADLEPVRFQQTLAGDAEHALEAFVALADCCGGLGRLLREAQRSRPQVTQIGAVGAAYRRWRRAERNAIRSSFKERQGVGRQNERSNLTRVKLTEGSSHMIANLTRKASLETMLRLGSLLDAEQAEKAGREPTTSADEFDGRNGYDPEFLDGWTIALPQPAGDMRELRRGGTGAELRYQNFSVIMSASRRLPLITAANIDGSESRRVPRIQTWSFDGRLDKEDQWGDALYDGNALDRGHMVRREDPVWGTLAEANLANEDTFHFTNSCPQMAGVNQQIWLGLEDYILKHAKADQMRVSVFTGPYFSSKDLEYRGARVPRAFWKVVAIVTPDGRPSATAYKVDQKKQLEDLEFVYSAYKTFQVSIRSVMQATKIDFGALIEYDGFSQHEGVGGVELEEQLDSVNDIRI